MKPTRRPPRREPVRMLDKYGRQVVCVPLAKGLGPAVVDAADYDTLMRLGLSSQWLVNGPAPGYVRAPVNGALGSLVGVSRIIMVAGAGRRVRYLDRNPLNLRRNNLRLVDGYATRIDAEAVVKAFERRLASAVEHNVRA